MASSPAPPPPPPHPNNRAESDETSRILCGQVNFPETNGEISVYGGTKSNNHS